MTTEPSQEQTAPTREVEWVYLGQRLTKDWRTLDVWLDDAGGRHSIAKMRGAGVGSRYAVTLEGDYVITAGPKGPRYLAQSDHPDRVQWSLEERHDLTRLETHRRAKREANDPLRELLAPLRAQYRSTIGTARRAALLAAIITEVTG